MDQSLIRNFAIIAHIDHGKSTLADRFMEMTNTVVKRDGQEQLLDSHPISRERGITIRLAPVTMSYCLLTTDLGPQLARTANSVYCLNLIDTPGHVDFSYEVERSLAACEGVILLVDATAGVQAQTLSHYHKAVKLGLTIIPVINKIDSPNAKVDETRNEIAELMKDYPLKKDNPFLKPLLVSAKTGEGVEDLLKAVVEKVPTPRGDSSLPLRALVFTSRFDPARGVTAYVRIVDGSIGTKSKIKFLASHAEASAFEIGHFCPAMTPGTVLETGEVGYVVTSLKDADLVRVGDTVTTDYRLLPTALSGYRDPQPMVFVSLFPVDQDDFKLLEDGLSKLKLNDAAITFALTSSKALGRGFRCGFLGHLHAEVSQERLERDFGLNVLATTPTVEYKAASSQQLADSKTRFSSPPLPLALSPYLEPWVKATIIAPEIYVGAVIRLCEDRRGKLIDMVYHGKNATLIYEIPLAEIITDFFDKLKSASSGYASMDYEPMDFRPFDAVNLDILINHEPVDAFSLMMEKGRAEKYGKFLVERLKEVIPRQQIPIPIQASINGQIVARADIPAFRKDVTAKLYGGDSTRRMKLLEKQKKGKEKMKSIGRVQIPGDTFLKIFRT